MIEYKVRVYESRTEWRNQNDELHRLSGPAVEWMSGDKLWYVDGKLHRLDGPAVEWDSVEWEERNKEWWIEGKQYSEEEFNEKSKKY